MLAPRLKELSLQHNETYQLLLDVGHSSFGSARRLAAMPAIQYLDLSRAFATTRQFSAALLQFSKSLKLLKFSDTQLMDGSWQDVFDVLSQIPMLRRVELSSLTRGVEQIDFSRLREPEAHIPGYWQRGDEWNEAKRGRWLVVFDGTHLQSSIELTRGKDYHDVRELAVWLQKRARLMPLMDFENQF